MLNSLQLEQIKPSVINLTGVRLLILFSLLLESPKTAEEINDFFEQNHYPKDMFSIDTLRNDINALRFAGCGISRADKTNNFKYNLLSHPFELNINAQTVESLSQIYKRTYQCLNINQLMSIERLFNVLSNYTKDEQVSENLKGISLIKNIDKDILKTLLQAEKNKSTISFDYNSPYSGILRYQFKQIYLNFRSEKLYINGFNETYNSFSFLPVTNILSPITIHLEENSNSSYEIRVTYELKNEAMKNFIESADDKILEKHGNKIIVEHVAHEYFKLNQKILAYGPNCTVLSPESVREYTISTLKEMYEDYKNDKI